jgi:hypothetical protein
VGVELAVPLAPGEPAEGEISAFLNQRLLNWSIGKVVHKARPSIVAEVDNDAQFDLAFGGLQFALTLATSPCAQLAEARALLANLGSHGPVTDRTACRRWQSRHLDCGEKIGLKGRS